MKRREHESIVLPHLPKPGEGERWYRDVAQAILVASGRSDYATVNAWTGQVRATGANPDEALRLDMCPPAFLSLDAKLAFALEAQIRQSSDRSLVMKLDRLKHASYARHNTSLLGWRTLREVLGHFFSLQSR